MVVCAAAAAELGDGKVRSSFPVFSVRRDVGSSGGLDWGWDFRVLNSM